MYTILNRLDYIIEKVDRTTPMYRGNLTNGSKWFVRTDVEGEWVSATPDQVFAIEQFFDQEKSNRIDVGYKTYFMVHRISGNTYVIQDRTHPKVYREIKKIGRGTLLNELPRS